VSEKRVLWSGIRNCKNYTFWTVTNGAEENHGTNVANSCLCNDPTKINFSSWLFFPRNDAVSLYSSSHSEIYIYDANQSNVVSFAFITAVLLKIQIYVNYAVA
jgi:hypothetical protein